MQPSERALVIQDHVNECRVELSQRQREQYFRNEIGTPSKLALLAKEIQQQTYHEILAVEIDTLLETAHENLELAKWHHQQRNQTAANPRELTRSSEYNPDEDQWIEWRTPDPTFKPAFEVRPGSPLLGKEVSNERGSHRLFRPSWFVAPWFRFMKLWWEGKFDEDNQFVVGGRKAVADGDERSVHLWGGPRGGWKPVLNQAQKLAFLTLPPEVEPTMADVHAVFKSQRWHDKFKPAPIDQHW